MAITWPATLPQKQFAGSLSVKALDQRVIFQPDRGEPVVRAAYSATVRQLTFSQVLDDDQLATLETFYFTTLKGGSLQFDWADLYPSGTQTYTFSEPYVVDDGGAPGVWRVGIALTQKASLT